MDFLALSALNTFYSATPARLLCSLMIVSPSPPHQSPLDTPLVVSSGTEVMPCKVRPRKYILQRRLNRGWKPVWILTSISVELAILSKELRKGLRISGWVQEIDSSITVGCLWFDNHPAGPLDFPRSTGARATVVKSLGLRSNGAR